MSFIERPPVRILSRDKVLYEGKWTDDINARAVSYCIANVRPVRVEFLEEGRLIFEVYPEDILYE